MTYLQEEINKYRVEIWDKMSPINGKDAELFKQRDDYFEDGIVLLCYYNDELAYVQPYHPFTGGKITEEDLPDLITQWIQVLAEPSARQKEEEDIANAQRLEEEQRVADLEEAIAYLLGGGA